MGRSKSYWIASTRRVVMAGWGTWVPSLRRERACQRSPRPIVEVSSVSKRPSPGWARGAIFQSSTNAALATTSTCPRSHDRRAMRWSRNQCRAPSARTAPRSTVTCNASSAEARSGVVGPPSVRTRSPPRSPTAGSGRLARRSDAIISTAAALSSTTTRSAGGRARSPQSVPFLTLMVSAPNRKGLRRRDGWHRRRGGPRWPWRDRWRSPRVARAGR